MNGVRPALVNQGFAEADVAPNPVAERVQSAGSGSADGQL